MRHLLPALDSTSPPSRLGLAPALILLAGLTGLGCQLTSTGTAPPGTECRVRTDCSGGLACVSGVCVAPTLVGSGSACVATRDCAAGLYCDDTGVCSKGGTGATGQACTTDAQCAPPLRCALAGFTGVCAASGEGDVGASCQAHPTCLSGLWCANDQTCQSRATAFPPYAGATCADEGAFRAYFEVPRLGRPPADFFRLPFPNDLRVAAGKLNIADFPMPGIGPLGVDFVRLYADAWTADFDGFSTIAPVIFRFSAPIDFATATGDSVQLIDLTPGDSLGAALARNWSFNAARGKYVCANRLVLRNALDTPLLPRHTYAAILTTGIRSTSGIAAVADADLALLLAPAQPTADATLAQAWLTYQPLRDWLTSRGNSAPAVAAAALFTVQDAPGHAQRLAAATAAQPAPVLSALTLCDAGVTSPCDDGTPDRACVAANPKFHEIHGKLTIPIFQQGTPPYDTAAAGGGILETAGAPQLARTEAVCFALAIPKGVAAPAAGWPLVVYHHDTGGSMRSIVGDGIAAALAGATPAAAVLGFDAVEHGARRGMTSTRSPVELMFNLLNPRAARDNLLQGAADIVQALRVAGVGISAASSPTGAAITFNPAAVAFFGHTQGSTSGQLALPFTDGALAAVLSGAGAFETAALLDRRSPTDLSAGLALAAGEPLDTLHPVMLLLQSFFDRSDPLNTNPLTLKRPAAPPHVSKHVLMTWGVGDSYTPTSALDANVLSLHIPAIRPLVESLEVLLVSRPVSLDVTAGDGKMRTGVMAQYMPSGAGGGYDGHFVALREPAAIADWTAFLQSYFATGTPTVP